MFHSHSHARFRPPACGPPDIGAIGRHCDHRLRGAEFRGYLAHRNFIDDHVPVEKLRFEMVFADKMPECIALERDGDVISVVETHLRERSGRPATPDPRADASFRGAFFSACTPIRTMLAATWLRRDFAAPPWPRDVRSSMRRGGRWDGRWDGFGRERAPAHGQRRNHSARRKDHHRSQCRQHFFGGLRQSRLYLDQERQIDFRCNRCGRLLGPGCHPLGGGCRDLQVQRRCRPCQPSRPCRGHREIHLHAAEPWPDRQHPERRHRHRRRLSAVQR
jgi:hypothetical protein